MFWDDLVNVKNEPKCICVCSCKANSQTEYFDEMMKVTDFLMGLNELYTNIRGQLLMMNSIPKMTQVLSLLQQEERQRSHINLAQPSIESAVLMNQTGNFRNFKKDFKKPEVRRNNLLCSHCNGTNHTRERCFHIIGFPPRKNQQRIIGFQQ